MISFNHRIKLGINSNVSGDNRESTTCQMFAEHFDVHIVAQIKREKLTIKFTTRTPVRLSSTIFDEYTISVTDPEYMES